METRLVCLVDQASWPVTRLFGYGVFGYELDRTRSSGARGVSNYK